MNTRIKRVFLSFPGKKVAHRIGYAFARISVIRIGSQVKLVPREHLAISETRIFVEDEVLESCEIERVIGFVSNCACESIVVECEDLDRLGFSIAAAICDAYGISRENIHGFSGEITSFPLASESYQSLKLAMLPNSSVA